MNKSKSPYSLFSNYRFMLSGMWNYDKSLIGYGIAEVIFGVLMPLGAVIVPSVVIGLLEDKAGIDVFIRNIIILFAIYGVIAAIQAFLTSRNRNQYIDIRMMLFSHRLFSKCMGMDYQLYENEGVREDKEKALRSTYTNQQGIEGIMHHNVKLLTNLLGMIAYAAIIGVINPVILLLLVVISLVQILVYNRAKIYEHSKKDEMSKLNVTQKYLQEQAFDLKAGKDIRMYQLNRLIDRVYDKTNRSLRNIKMKIQGAYYANDVVEVILKFVRDAVCYGYLIYLLMNGLKVSYFVLYIGIVGGLATWVMKITEEVSKISRDLLMISDFREFIDMKDKFQHKGGKEITEEDTAFDIVFDHVSYRYKGASDYVLRDVSFHMKKGDTFAVVGINGAGKTTLVKLMCGFYQPTEGRILINGVDMKELNIEGYFKKIAVVFQDSNTLSFTIGENISGEETKYINKEKLNKALELSGLKSKIDKLEKGTDTYLNKDMDDSGIQLSGGELQKLMLAKALYKEARLLLLDEPTAALDAIAESELYEKYQGLLKGKTSLFISHRLASTRFCNHILFLENGRIAEEGNHDILMNQKGKYAEMFNVQSQYYKEDEYETEENLV